MKTKIERLPPVRVTYGTRGRIIKLAEKAKRTETDLLRVWILERLEIEEKKRKK